MVTRILLTFRQAPYWKDAEAEKSLFIEPTCMAPFKLFQMAPSGILLLQIKQISRRHDMRYYFLGDIHGNMAALKRCTDHIDGSRVDEAYCMGDIVGWLPFGDRTLKYMRSGSGALRRPSPSDRPHAGQRL